MQAFSNLHVDNTPYPGCMLTSIYCVTKNYMKALYIYQSRMVIGQSDILGNFGNGP